MLLIVDNYDSFTYNLVQRIGEIGIKQGSIPTMKVIRNDELTVQEVKDLNQAGFFYLLDLVRRIRAVSAVI